MSANSDITTKRDTLPFDEAVAFLPDGDRVHTFRGSGPMMLGADWQRDKLIAAMRKADAVHITGEFAQSMKHGLAIYDGGMLFIATKGKVA